MILFLKSLSLRLFLSIGSSLPLCSSTISSPHIRNEEIHLSADQIGFLESPYKSGTYTGRGGASYSVNVGFKPRIVIVAALNGPPMSIDFSAQVGYIYSGIACETGGTYGIELTDTGFKVTSQRTTPSRGCYPALNESVVPYRYIAFK